MNKPVTRKRFNLNDLLKAIFICLFWGLFWSASPLIGWSSYALEGIQTSCSLKWENSTFSSLIYNITVFLMVLLGPLIFLITISYKLIKLVKTSFLFSVSLVLLFVNKN
jgi:c-opsin